VCVVVRQLLSACMIPVSVNGGAGNHTGHAFTSTSDDTLILSMYVCVCMYVCVYVCVCYVCMYDKCIYMCMYRYILLYVCAYYVFSRSFMCVRVL